MSYARAKPLDARAIPVIDIAPLRDGSDRDGVSRALLAASQGLGFIYIEGHGIPDAVIDGARRTTLDFFRAPEADKARVRVSAAHRGWIAQGGSRMRDDVASDLKESFVWGDQDASGLTPGDHPLRGANRWPDSTPDLPRYAMAWFDEASRVAHHLLRGFATGLGLPEGLFLRHVERPLSRASSVYYPPQPEASGPERFGVGPHTDFGVLTVLCQDATGGLQVQDASGEWLEAPPIEGTLVVNVADLLSRWTEGACKSTPHRVVNRSGRERLSLVLAFDPDPDTLVDARDVHGPDHVSAHAPIRCGDYLLERFDRAFAHRSAAR